jgi:hypothetical protein
MDNLTLKRVPVAKTGMLIRRPVAEVFAAFIDPGVTTKFWFTKSSVGSKSISRLNGNGRCMAPQPE